MFDTDCIACELPVGFTFEFDKSDNVYLLFFEGNQMDGSFYHYTEMVEAAIAHKQLIEWHAANSHW